MHHLLSVAAYVLDEEKPLHAGEVQTKNVAEVSEDEARGYTQYGTQQYKSKFNMSSQGSTDETNTTESIGSQSSLKIRV